MNINGGIDTVLPYEKGALLLCSVGLGVLAVTKLFSFLKIIDNSTQRKPHAEN
jgi:hypothetical protein